MVKKHAAVLPLIITALLLTGCEYFNAPIQPFIDMNTAVVSLNTMGIGTQPEDACYMEYIPGQQYFDIPVVLNNPQQFNIQAAIKSAVKNGDPASGVSVVSWTKNDALVRIRGAAQEDAYRITLRITSKDGVASGERTFDIPLPRIVFAAQQNIVEPKVVLVDGTAHAQVKILKDSMNAPLKNVIIQFKYVDAVISSNPSAPVNPRPQPTTMDVTYAWDDAAGGLLLNGSPVEGFSAQLVNGYLEFDLPFPANFVPLHPAFDEISILGCSFKITVEDELGATAEKKSPGFDRAHCNYKVEWNGIQYYGNLNDAMADVNSRGLGGTAYNEIIVREDLTHSGTVNLDGGKHILLTVPPNESKTISLDAAHPAASTVFEVKNGATLIFSGNGSGGVLTVDGAAKTLTNAALVHVEAGSSLGLIDNAVLRNIKSTTVSLIRIRGSFEMQEGSTIADMKSDEGAVEVMTGGAFIMNGGTIEGNTAYSTGENIGVKVSSGGTFTMKGSAVVNPNNSVYLANGTTITIGQNLTGTAPVATITPQPNIVNMAVLTDNLTEANIMRFALSDSAWYIQSTGTNKGKIHNVKTASRTVSGATLYYPTLTEAVSATSGTSTTPDVLTVLADINMGPGTNLTVPSGKYVKLVSDATRRTLKRAAGNTASLITVNGHLTLENIIVDGGAVWSGGTATPPSPAYGATNNTDAGGLNALNTLVFVSGAAAKLTLGDAAVVQNNIHPGGGANLSNLGGGIRATGGAQVVINGTGAAVRYNGANWVGGGIALHDTSAQGTKLTLINGSVDNNSATAHDGGGIATEYGIVEIQGGVVTQNYALDKGGGIFYSHCDAGLTAVISGGSISNNRANKGGGIMIGSPWTITMSGSAVISGNEATTNGGGIYMESGNFTLTGSAAISGNTATTNGGGIYMESGNFTLTDSAVISGNEATTNGGGIYMEGGNFTLTDSAAISGNTAQDGGGISVTKAGATDSVFTLEGEALIDGNTASSFGGGFNINKSATVVMYNGTISNNTGIGGGVAVSGTDATFTMNGGTISGNNSWNEGGGVYIGNTARFTMYGGSIRANSADTLSGSKVGGGVFVSNFSWGGKGYFIKRGGTIYGNAEGDYSNIAPGGGPAVFAGDSTDLAASSNKYRNVTAGDSVRMYFYNGGMTDPDGNSNTSSEWLP